MPASVAPVATVLAPDGMVATADQLATQAGLDVRAAGGSAADAAIAANAVLAVTAPHLCGMGGDLFALVHLPGEPAPRALNASGRAGSGADPARLRAEGHRVMPFRGDIRAVTVPGCVDGWLALHQAHGRLPLARVLAAAIGYARHGFPASPLLVASARGWTGAPPELAPARAGARVVRPGVADALGSIAAEGRDGFYGGAFGRGLLALGAGEYLAEDLRRPLADWVEPLGAPAFGHVVWTVPPNSQGYLALAGAWIADGLPLPDDPADPLWAHLLVEAAVQAGHDRPAVLHEHANGPALVAERRLAARRRAVTTDAASGWPLAARAGDTTYLCAVDADRMAVSLIQSNASGFGSWLVEPATGINLHNRGMGFSLEEGHPAEYGPGRRPPHTLAPLVVTEPDGRFVAVLGTQGGDGQPQILLQLLARLLRHRQRPAEALAEPRWVLTGTGRGFDTWTAPDGPAVTVERRAAPAWHDGLAALGHRVVVADDWDHGFGHAQVIRDAGDGFLAGAADPRARIGAAAGR